MMFYMLLYYCILFCIDVFCSWEKIYTSFGWRKFPPENSIWNTAVSLLSYSCMFQVEICSQQLEISNPCARLSSSPLLWRLTFGCFVPIMTSRRKVNIHGCFVSTHTFLTMIIDESVCFMSSEPIFLLQLFLCGTYEIYIYIFFINWTVHMSDNLPARVQILGHAHIICITVRKNRIICCQIFCDLLLKSAFELIFNVMQLILVKIKWHIKWKYLPVIQKFHDICLSYYFKDTSRHTYI